MIAPAILAWIGRYGYAAVAVGVFLESTGVPVPGETVVLAAAFAAAHEGGGLSLGRVIVTAAVAGVLGDNMGYFLGRRYGRAWLERHGRLVRLSPAQLMRLDAFFARFGPAAVAIARFVAGVRVMAAFAAGASHMAWGTFLIFNIVGAVLWSAAVGAAGYALGHGYTQAARWLGDAGVVLVLALLVALLATRIWRRARRQ
jgi:membrane protein DedA with SNARE-associated domain